ncbi:hypothetical protein [Parasphingorhabdus sp.]|uniref:hypothetical protein n=1 Tax=Parasphingorhabdus sp. TaxID=2709688 RepID=UPI003002B625
MIFPSYGLALCDQGSGMLNSWTDTCGNQDGGREKSGKGGGDMVLDVYVGHFEIPLGLNRCFAVAVSEDTNNIAWAVPVLVYCVISSAYLYIGQKPRSHDAD